MELTLYPQSCMVLSAGGKRLLVDYGSFAAATYSLDAIGPIDAAIYTHRHGDHLVVEAAQQLLAAGVPVHGNADVQAAIGQDISVIAPGDSFEAARIPITAVDVPHCHMVDGSEAGVEHTGFVIQEKLLLPGDSVKVPDGVRVSHIATPIFGPDISFRDAYEQVQKSGARVAIPVHYEVAGLNPESFRVLGSLGGELPFEYLPLEYGAPHHLWER